MREPKKVPGIENRRRQRRDGSPYWTFRVRWLDPVTRDRMGEEFDSQQDAMDFRAALRLATRSGTLHEMSAGRESVAEFAEHWWATYAASSLERQTLAPYASIWNNHLLGRVGHLQLRAVTPGVIARLRTDLEQAHVGPPTIRKAMSLLQGMLRRAVEEDRIRQNPALQVRKPAAPRTRAVRPLPPESVEAVRASMLARGRADRRLTAQDRIENLRDATLVSVLAYSGPRPEDALALEWPHVRKSTLLYEQKNIDGKIVPGQKVDGKPPRSTDLLDALRTDLAELNLALGRPKLGLVFARDDGGAWRDHDYRNWRRRVFQPAMADVGLAKLEETVTVVNVDGQRRRRLRTRYDGPRPYDLRHSFVSLMIHEGRLSPVELAVQVGNSAETLLRVYSHVFADLRAEAKTPANQMIALARAARAERTG